MVAVAVRRQLTQGFAVCRPGIAGRQMAVREELVVVAGTAHIVRFPGVTALCGRYVPDTAVEIGPGYTLYSGQLCTSCALAGPVSDISERGAEKLEAAFGPGWRIGLDVNQESLRRLEEATRQLGDDTARVEAWMPILDVLADRLAEGEVSRETLIADVAREAFGGHPSREQLTAVTEVVENIYRLQRGLPPLEPGP
jgi:hypothetical protein